MSDPGSEDTMHAGLHQRGYLPHVDAPDVEQSVTYRLADAIPTDALLRMVREHAACPQGERERRLRAAIERFNDTGIGSCLPAQ